MSFPDAVGRFPRHRLEAAIPRAFLTSDFGLERAAGDVVGPPVLDADHVVSGGHGSVVDLVALWTLLALHLDFGRALDGERQRSGPSFGVIDDKL